MGLFFVGLNINLSLVSVILRLEWSLWGNPDVFGLITAQFCEFYADLL
jgi:hypothetical protein